MSWKEPMTRADKSFFRKHFKRGRPAMADLLWMIDGKEQEVITACKPYAICHAEKNKRQKSGNYNIGTLEVMPAANRI